MYVYVYAYTDTRKSKWWASRSRVVDGGVSNKRVAGFDISVFVVDVEVFLIEVEGVVLDMTVFLCGAYTNVYLPRNLLVIIGLLSFRIALSRW